MGQQGAEGAFWGQQDSQEQLQRNVGTQPSMNATEMWTLAK